MSARVADPSAPAYIRHAGLIRVVIRRYFLALLHQGYEYDDLVQEGLLELWRAEKGYSPEKGKEAGYYARCIYNGINNRCVMPIVRLKRRSNVGMIELDAPIRTQKSGTGREITLMDTLAGDGGNFANRIAKKDALERCIRKLDGSPRLKRVIRRRYLDEWTYKEIGAEIGAVARGHAA